MFIYLLYKDLISDVLPRCRKAILYCNILLNIHIKIAVSIYNHDKTSLNTAAYCGLLSITQRPLQSLVVSSKLSPPYNQIKVPQRECLFSPSSL